MPLPSWEIAKELADGPLGGDGPPGSNQGGEGEGTCDKCGQQLEDDKFDEDKKRPR